MCVDSAMLCVDSDMLCVLCIDLAMLCVDSPMLCVSEWRVLHVAISDILVFHRGLGQPGRLAHLQRDPLHSLDQETDVMYRWVNDAILHTTIIQYSEKLLSCIDG